MSTQRVFSHSWQTQELRLFQILTVWLRFWLTKKLIRFLELISLVRELEKWSLRLLLVLNMVLALKIWLEPVMPIPLFQKLSRKLAWQLTISPFISDCCYCILYVFYYSFEKCPNINFNQVRISIQNHFLYKDRTSSGKSLKYSCSNASLAVIRSDGFGWSIFDNRSIPFSSSLGTILSKGIGSYLSNL